MSYYGIRLTGTDISNTKIHDNYVRSTPYRKMTFMQKVRYVIKFWRNN